MQQLLQQIVKIKVVRIGTVKVKMFDGTVQTLVMKDLLKLGRNER